MMAMITTPVVRPRLARSVIRQIVAVAAWLALAGLSSCSTTASSTYNNVPVDSRLAVQAASLGPGDEFEVRVYEEPALSGSFVVSPTGQVDYPLLGSLTVEGLTPQQVAGLIRTRLAAKYIRQPYVVVQVKTLNSKKIIVLGEVKSPGRFNYGDRMTIVEAITLAGGFTTLAERNYTIVTRGEAAGTRRVAVPVEKIMQGLAANFLLQPGDIVFVPETIL